MNAADHCLKKTGYKHTHFLRNKLTRIPEIWVIVVCLSMANAMPNPPTDRQLHYLEQYRQMVEDMLAKIPDVSKTVDRLYMLELQRQLVQLYEETDCPGTDYKLKMLAGTDIYSTGSRARIESTSGGESWAKGVATLSESFVRGIGKISVPDRITWSAYGTVGMVSYLIAHQGLYVRWFIADGVLYRFSMFIAEKERHHELADIDTRPKLKFVRLGPGPEQEIDIPADIDRTKLPPNPINDMILFAHQVREQELLNPRFLLDD